MVGVPQAVHHRIGHVHEVAGCPQLTEQVVLQLHHPAGPVPELQVALAHPEHLGDDPGGGNRQSGDSVVFLLRHEPPDIGELLHRPAVLPRNHLEYPLLIVQKDGASALGGGGNRYDVARVDCTFLHRLAHRIQRGPHHLMDILFHPVGPGIATAIFAVGLSQHSAVRIENRGLCSRRTHVDCR